MNLRLYFTDRFRKDLETLKCERPSDTIMGNPADFEVDQYTTFFGAEKWANIHTDLEGVQEADREKFLLCLFTAVVLDRVLSTRFPGHYSAFRERTRYPKFGWSGMAPHSEPPSLLLEVPLERKLVTYDETRVHLQEFVSFFLDECRLVSNVDTRELVVALLSDETIGVKGQFRTTIIGKFGYALQQWLDIETSKL